jgi:undecaprenyl diphosphate synthase
MPAILPRHVAIIPDGNRRWARVHGHTVFNGHQAGVRAFERIATHAADSGVEHLSLWGMSADNLRKRSAREVVGLLSIFRTEFLHLARSAEIHKRETKITVLGQWHEKFPAPVKQSIQKAMAATSHYRKHHLNFFLVYNGTDEMLRAVRGIVKQARTEPRVRITARLLKQHLLTRELPPVDLLIRTAGEPHLSAGFMMWDVADAQLYFTPTLWPDFTPAVFDAALDEFAQRERRFGS